MINLITKIPENLYNRSDLVGYCIRGAYQKRHKTIVHLNDTTVLDLCRAQAERSGSKKLAMFCNYWHANKLSYIHHRYYMKDPIFGLDILEPNDLKRVTSGVIGSFHGAELWYSDSDLAERFPPILINSASENPITFEMNHPDPSNWSPKDISIHDKTVFANCTQIVEQQLRIAMNAFDNFESFKKFIGALSRDLEEKRIAAQERRGYGRTTDA